MLTIHFGEMENVNYGPSWFKYNYEPQWLEDPLVQEMIRDVDKTNYLGGLVFESPVFGPMSPDRLSGGVQTLIMIYERPDLVFDATSCGGNCAKWLLKIGSLKDVTVNLNYLMHFDGLEPFEIYLDNEERVLHTNEEYVLAAIKYV